MSNDKITTFDVTLQKSYGWIGDVGDALEITSKKDAYRSLRAVLHALRDQLDTPEVAQLSAQLPLLLRGVYYEGWVPGGRSHVRTEEEFLDLVMENHGARPHTRPDAMVTGVWRVIASHIGEHEAEQVCGRLAEPVRALLTEKAHTG